METQYLRQLVGKARSFQKGLRALLGFHKRAFLLLAWLREKDLRQWWKATKKGRLILSITLTQGFIPISKDWYIFTEPANLYKTNGLS